MRIDIDNGIIFNSENGTKICDVEELETYGQARYIIELLLDDRQELEEEIISLQEDYNVIEEELRDMKEHYNNKEGWGFDYED